ncbi:MAG: siroheme decarboxylase subunit beta [Planctomycetota bacterium]|jgi:heme b synthase
MADPEGRHCVPRLIAWEVTRYCVLACKHCPGAARQAHYEGELTTEECFKLLENIASFASPIIILTGGEPMARPDVCEIACRGTELGLRVVMAPCGVLLNDETAAGLVASGIEHIAISLDGATAQSHDAFRGVEGAFEAALEGLQAAKRAGLSFQINTTVSRHNVHELPRILGLAVELGADVFNPFLLVPTGRGRNLADQEISPRRYEETLNWLAEQQERPDIGIRVTCAPHYQRILRSRPGGQPGHGVGCMGGKSFAFISHRGKVQICGFLDVECGDVRQEDYDFRRIWETSEVMRRIRDMDSYGGRCGYCEFRAVCGGCRARAYALSGDYLAEEPYCVYEPRRAPGEMDEMDRRILSVIQTEMPVTERPYDALAARLGADAKEVYEGISRLRRWGLIRRLGPIFDSRRLGYASTLVAARVPPERLEEVAETVSALPGVTHNYRREHDYNLWFTLTAPSEQALERTLEDLRRDIGVSEVHSLPALAVYKIRVNFRLSDEEAEPDAAPAGPSGPAVELSEEQKELVRLLQEDLPPGPDPFAAVADQLGWPTERVVRQVRRWLEEGVIRRFGAVVRHRRLGFRANGMAVFRVSEERVDAVGRQLAGHAEVSHCYRRPSMPGWDYNLFAMVHGKSPEEVRDLVSRLAQELDAPDYQVLFSTTQYKKTSVNYFVGSAES